MLYIQHKIVLHFSTEQYILCITYMYSMNELLLSHTCKGNRSWKPRILAHGYKSGQIGRRKVKCNLATFHSLPQTAENNNNKQYSFNIVAMYWIFVVPKNYTIFFVIPCHLSFLGLSKESNFSLGMGKKVKWCLMDYPIR